MTDLPLHAKTDDALLLEIRGWERSVEDAAGWASAYHAATWLKAAVVEANRRGLNVALKYKIETA